MIINHDLLRWRLEELSNRVEQERLWLGGGGQEMSSFAETVCGIFDDAGVTRPIDGDTVGAQYLSLFCSKIKELDCLIRDVPQAVSPSVQINHPTMDAVRQLSGELLTLS